MQLSFLIFMVLCISLFLDVCKNENLMPTGISFYLILSFKFALGNWFLDSLSQPSQRAITDTNSVSLTFFSPPPYYHVQSIVSKKVDHQITATAYVSYFMLDQTDQDLHERISCLVSSEIGILQIAPPRTAMFLS